MHRHELPPPTGPPRADASERRDAEVSVVWRPRWAFVVLPTGALAGVTGAAVHATSRPLYWLRVAMAAATAAALPVR